MLRVTNVHKIYDCMEFQTVHSCAYNMLELNTEKEGCMSYTTPEDAQRPRDVYDIHPDFRGI